MKLESTVAVRDEFEFRAQYYFLLSKLLFEPPTQHTLQAVSYFGVPASRASNKFLVTLNRLAEAASQEPSLEQLDDEYHDLFIGVGRG